MFEHNRTMSIRRRLTRGAALGALATGLLATSVSAATTSVTVNDSRSFNPAAVNQTAGGSVHWTWTGVDDHSVTQDQRLFDSGVGAGLDFTRTFSAGTFGYHCLEHGTATSGMRGQIRVAPQVLTAPRGLPFTVRWATTTQTGNRFDVQYRVGSGAWRNWFSDTSARSAVFGNRSRPVRLARGKTYSFRVWSQLGTARSGVSPVKSFRAR